MADCLQGVFARKKIVILARWKETKRVSRGLDWTEVTHPGKKPIIKYSLDALKKGKIVEAGISDEVILTPDEIIQTEIISKADLISLIKKSKTKKPSLKEMRTTEFFGLSKARQAYELQRKDISDIEAIILSEEDALRIMRQKNLTLRGRKK